MNRSLRVAAHVVVAALLGAGLAAVAYYLFFVPPLAGFNLIVWALVALAIGLIVHSWGLVILDCAITGFTIVLTYSILGYQGADPLPSAIPIFVLIALVGALGMTVVGTAAHLVQTRIKRRPAKP
ncbi:MAG: hypothetical protein ABI435_10285 [Pseudolysinimonas sp.]